MQDKMHINDSVSIQLEQIEPWSDKQSQEQLDALREQVNDVLNQFSDAHIQHLPIRNCNHTVKTDVTSQYSLITAPQLCQADQALQTEPIPKGTMILQCIECKQIFWESSNQNVSSSEHKSIDGEKQNAEQRNTER